MAVASAQESRTPSTILTSLEMAVAKHPVVVQASVVDVVMHETEKQVNPSWTKVPLTVRLRPTRWFKSYVSSDADPPIEIQVSHDVYLHKFQGNGAYVDAFGNQTIAVERLKKLLESGQERVWFIETMLDEKLHDKRKEVCQKFSSSHFLDQAVGANDQRESFPVMQLDLRCYSTEREFIAAVEEFATLDCQFLQNFACWDPCRNNTAEKFIFVEVVGGTRLENLAKSMANDPSQFCYRTNGQGEQIECENFEFQKSMTRLTGLKLMKGFRSAENIALAKELLLDTGFVYRNWPLGEKMVVAKEFVVQEAAKKLLRSWGETVEQTAPRQVVDIDRANIPPEIASRLTSQSYWHYPISDTHQYFILKETNEE